MAADAAPGAGDPLEGCARGTMAPHLALMHLIMRSAAPADVDAAIARALCAEADATARHRLAGLAELWQQTPAAWDTVKRILAAVDHRPPVSEADAAAHWSRAFDQAAAISGEAGSALYTLGRADLFERATGEIVSWISAQGLLRRGCTILELGCGTGRFAPALAQSAQLYVGIDVSFAMLQRATRQAVAGNAVFVRTGGRDLAAFADASIDLLLAVDSCPYLVLTGSACVETHFCDFARVLRPAGAAVILNFSYGGDADADRAAVGQLAAASGLVTALNGVRPFAEWDGLAFILRRPEVA